MVVAPLKRRAWLWIALSFGLLVLSVIAIAVRAMGFPEYVPRAITKALGYFIEPGAAVWWLTIGGAFQGFPSDVAGYVVTSVANMAFWTLACVVFTAVWRITVRAVRRMQKSSRE